jgi:uncharacterized protein YndB with AHSA1/START domain
VLHTISPVRPDRLSLEMTREFPARRARVFEFFADAARLTKWWGPSGFSIPSVDFTPRVGATYRIEMQPPEGEAFQLTGTFRELDAPSQLAFSFEWEPADPDDQETVAQLSFQVVDDSTKVHLVQGPFRTDARRALHRDGWTESFDKLGRLVAEQR